MKCRRIHDLASWYVGGDLSAREAAQVEAHLAECRTCRDEIEAMLQAVDALEAPKSVREAPDVLALVKQELARPRRSFRPVYAAVAFAGAAAVLAILLATRQVPPTSTHSQVQVVETAPPSADGAPPLPKDRPKAVQAERLPESCGRNKGTEAVSPARMVEKPRRRTPLGPANSAPAPNEPECEYLVVYVPDIPGVESGPSQQQRVEETAYSIRSTDETTGQTVELSVRKQDTPDRGPVITLDYGISNASIQQINNERSLPDEDTSNHPAAHPGST